MRLPSETSPRPPIISVGLVSAAALGYEILLMRLFSIIQWHHFAYLIISLALLGYGASGTFVALSKTYLLRHFTLAYWLNLILFGVATVVCYLATQAIPFNAEEILWDWQQSVYLLTIYLLLSVPFFFAANGVALALTRHSKEVARIYAADLLGAGLGSLGIVLLLFTVFPVAALKYLGALGLFSAFVAVCELKSNRRSLYVTALLGTLLLLALPIEWLELNISPYKGVSQTLRISGTHIVKERSSPLGFLTVLESPVIPLRHAPGLSLTSTAPIPKQLGLFTDSDALTTIDQNPRGQPLAYLDQLTSALPYYLMDPKHVLILGAGGGAGVQQALNHQVQRIEVVEINPQVIELVRNDYAEWSGRLYERKGVRVHISDARAFIRRSEGQYDLIQLNLQNSFGASAAGLHALSEDYLYTVEALQDYFGHLLPGGYLAISGWIKLPPRDVLKLYATAVSALRGLNDLPPHRQLVLIRGWQTSTLLIKNGPFTDREIAHLRAFCKARLFDVAWYPGMTVSEANHFNILKQPYFFQAASALAGDNADIFIDRYKFDIKPVTDDRPYFFHFFKWSVLPEILVLRGQGGIPLLEAGYLVLVATLLQALAISIVLILIPLWVVRKQRKHTESTISRTRLVIYFSAVGLGFLLVEIAFIQKFILFLHHPTYAIATVLTAFLLFAGAGSACTQSIKNRLGPMAQHTGKVVACIVVIGAIYMILLTPLLSSLTLSHMVQRTFATIMLIAPLAFCMGVPFPLGLARLAEETPRFIPWAWGINGCASVISAVLATLLAIQFGFTVVILSALFMYVIAALTFP